MSSFLLRREETSSRVIVSRIVGRVQLGSKWFAFRFLPLLPFWRWVCRGINRRLPKFTLLLPLNTFRHSHPCLYCVKTGMNNYRDSQFLCSSFFAKNLLSGFWSFELLNKDREEKKRFSIFPSFPPLPSPRFLLEAFGIIPSSIRPKLLGEPLMKRVGIQLGRSLEPGIRGH